MEDYSTETFWNELKSGKFASMVKESCKGQTLGSSQEAFNVIKPMIQSHDDIEILYGIFMDRKNHVLSIEELFRGSITGTSVYPREIVKRVLHLKATSIVFVHNHPSGCPDPSPEDRDITVHIALVMQTIGVNILDHIIIGERYHSMADSGWIPKMKDKLKNVLTSIRDC
jgi:DNA repair protein RadC